MKKRKLAKLLIFLLVFLIFLPNPVFAQPLGIETLITTNTLNSNQRSPSIYQNLIVWEDYRNNFTDIYSYDVVSGIESLITENTTNSNQVTPAIFGNYIVWQDDRNGNWDIYLYDIAQKIEIQVTSNTANQTAPTIYGNYIVWQDDRNGNWDIYCNDIQLTYEIQVTNDTSDQIAPAIFSIYIVWQDYRNGNWDIYFNDVGLTNEIQVTNDTSDDITPAIYENYIVWAGVGESPIGYTDIFLYDILLEEVTPITSDTLFSDQSAPSISGDRLVWQDDREDTSYDINMSYITNGTANLISIGPPLSAQTAPVIYGDRIVWEDDRNGLYDIYMYSFGSFSPCPVADFTSDIQTGNAPLFVQFYDTSSEKPTTWHWDFGDGTTSNGQNVSHLYSSPGVFSVVLTISTPQCRDTKRINDYITVQRRPTANFTAVPTSGSAPLNVQFNDTSAGSPTNWTWDFGDNTPLVNDQNPIHTYSVPGRYTVIFNVSNSYGSNEVVRPYFITVKGETQQVACTNYTGIEIQEQGSLQQIQFNTSYFTNNYTFNPGMNIIIDFVPPVDSGLKTIRLYSSDGIGFNETPDGLIAGNITGVIIENQAIVPMGFSEAIGSECSVAYRINLSRYPINTCITTSMWEGDTPEDHQKFLRTMVLTNFASMFGPAYTIKFTSSTILPPINLANLTVSVNSSWVDQVGAWVNQANGQNFTWVIRVQDDNQAEVLPVRFLFNDAINNLDYFDVGSPRGLSTFALTGLSGSGNPLQLLRLFFETHVGGGDGGSSPEPVCTWTKDGQQYTAYNIQDCPTTVPPTSSIPQATITSTLPLPTVTPELTQVLTTPTPIEEVITPPMTPAPKVQEPLTPITIFSKFILNIVKWVMNNIAISAVIIAAVCIASYTLWKRRQVF